MLKFGAQEEQLLLIAKKGVRVEALYQKPILSADLQQVWNVFTDLHSSRGGGGFEPGAITATQISSTLDFYFIDDRNERQRYYTLLRALDNEWRKLTGEKNANSSHSNIRKRRKDGRG